VLKQADLRCGEMRRGLCRGERDAIIVQYCSDSRERDKTKTMSQVVTNADVLTLEEAANFLRVSVQTAEELADRGTIPGRRIRDEWRFLKSALEDWLRRPDYKQALLNQAGILRDDESLTELRNAIYAARGRPEVDDSTEG